MPLLPAGQIMLSNEEREALQAIVRSPPSFRSHRRSPRPSEHLC